MNERSGYTIVPAAAEDIAWMAGIEAEAYGPVDAIPEAVLRKWFEANPSGFSVIRAPGGGKAGHIDILPIRSGVLEAFVNGRLIEREIPGTAIYGPEEKGRIRELYVESVIILPEEGRSRAAAGRRLIEAFPSLVERVCDPALVRRIFAIAASGPGERLVRRLGFELFIKGEARPDGHDLFCLRQIPDLPA